MSFENQLISSVLLNENSTFGVFHESSLTHKKMSALQSNVETKSPTSTMKFRIFITNLEI